MYTDTCPSETFQGVAMEEQSPLSSYLYTSQSSYSLKHSNICPPIIPKASISLIYVHVYPSHHLTHAYSLQLIKQCQDVAFHHLHAPQVLHG